MIHKVTAFITRDTDRRRDLLVFQHPIAGVQLPAGTVDVGESPARAAYREACEETGLCDLSLVGLLAELPSQLGPNQYRLVRSVHLRTSPQPDSPLTDYRMPYGWMVDLIELDSATGAAKIRYPEMKYLGGDRWEVEFEWVGWVDESALTSQETRLAYHLHCDAPTPEFWEHLGDHDLVFRCFWVDVQADPPLIPLHSRWFDVVKDQLRST